MRSQGSSTASCALTTAGSVRVGSGGGVKVGVGSGGGVKVGVGSGGGVKVGVGSGVGDAAPTPHAARMARTTTARRSARTRSGSGRLTGLPLDFFGLFIPAFPCTSLSWSGELRLCRLAAEINAATARGQAGGGHDGISGYASEAGWERQGRCVSATRVTQRRRLPPKVLSTVIASKVLSPVRGGELERGPSHPPISAPRPLRHSRPLPSFPRKREPRYPTSPL